MAINYNLACAVHRHSLATPDAIAVVYKDRSVSYRELAERAASLAECLKRRPNWPRQDGTPPRVGILASRGIDACVALLGTCWAGATYVPISLKLPEERLLMLLSLCNLSAIIADKEGTKQLSKKVLGACPHLVIHAARDLEAPPDSHIELIDIESLTATELGVPSPMKANDIAYIIFTSGTTGVPKGVMIPSGSIRHFLEMITLLLDLRASDRALETCELSFDVSVHNMFSTWQVGASLHILPSTMTMNAVKFARQSQLTIWTSVPSLVGMLRQVKALSPGILPDLRVTVFGGEQLPERIVAAWQTSAINSAVYNLYGPTEVTVFCLGQAITRPIPLTPGRDFVAIGTPLPGNNAMVVSENGEVVADGIAGELVVAGVQLAEGYLNAPELTAARFPILGGKRWYRTGDLAMRDDAGTFHCLGRIDNQVKVLGYRVELEEIDAHLRVVTHSDVVGSVAWPSLDGMVHGIVCFVGGPTIDSDRVIAALKARLPAYMVPNRVIALEHMPLNPSGKVDRRALRQLLDQESA